MLVIEAGRVFVGFAMGAERSLAPAWHGLLEAPRPVWIGERLNADGSAAVRDALRLGAYERLAQIAREQVAAGARALDVRVGAQGAELGRVVSSELNRWASVLDRLAGAVRVPFFADSADPKILRGAARHLPGRVGLNSVSLALERTVLLTAAVEAAELKVPLVAQLRDGEWEVPPSRRLELARSLRAVLLEDAGLPAEAVWLDPVTLPFRRPAGGYRRDAGLQALETLRLLKREWPQAMTVTAISNLTFGLDPKARPALNALYLANAGREGLDFAILNPRQIRQAPPAVDDLWALSQYALFDGREAALEEYVAAACARTPSS